MRYEKGHKDTTRDRIIDVASGRFRESGVAGVGLAGIMADAGLTNGAFYLHFDSKEDLVLTVLLNALDRRAATLRAASEAGVPLGDSLRDYLSPRHRDNPARGCPTAALAAEVARHPSKTRDAFTGKVSEIIALIAARIRTGSAAERRRKAAATYGMMVGALQLARAVNDKDMSDEILQGAIDAALELAGER